MLRIRTAILILVLVSLGTVSPLSAGQMIYKNMYSQDLVQGIGRTFEEAKQDAVSAIPADYIEDPENSAMVDCMVSVERLIATHGEDCDITIPGNLARIVIPLKKIDH